MDSLLNHPAVQSGIIPFIVSILIILVLGKIKPRLTGFAAIIAFTVSVAMAMGFSPTPLTSPKKIVLLTYFVAIIGVILDMADERVNRYRYVIHTALAVIGAIGLLWVIWPVVSREGSQHSLSIAVGLCAYVVWILLGISSAHKKPEQISIAVFALAMGTAVVSIIGATALYGQLAAPFAAATGAWLLFYLFVSQRGSFPAGIYLSAASCCAMLGAAATVYASLKWPTLAIFALIPIVVHIPYKVDSATWIKLLKLSVAASIPVLAAIWYTAQQSADSGYYG